MVLHDVLNHGRRGEAGERGRTAHASPSVFCPFQKCTVTEAMKGAPNRVNVFERCLTIPGLSEESIAATMPCLLRLYSVLDKLAGYVVTTIDFFQQADANGREN